MTNRAQVSLERAVLGVSCVLMSIAMAGGLARAAEIAAIPPPARTEGKLENPALCRFVADPAGSRIVPAEPEKYADHRPGAPYRLEAQDQGVVLKHGDGPGKCDILGAREALVYEADGTYYLHYDGAGPRGWLACLAVSKDLIHWTKKGPVLDLGKRSEDDSATASSPWVHFDGKQWHMFYVGSARATPPPELIPAVPYVTMKARASSPSGPWIKQPGVVPFRPQPGTYYSDTASAGDILRHNNEYLMFFSAAMLRPRGSELVFYRTIGLARTRNLDGPWKVDPEPIVPPTEQLENSSMYYEPTNQTWFLFVNHIGVAAGAGEYGDAVWVYWTRDLNRWDTAHKAVVLDGKNCGWSSRCIGVASVVKAGNRLAILYDAAGGDSTSNMRRDIGLAWLNLPLVLPPGSVD